MVSDPSLLSVDLSSKVALVTGGTRGIGKTIAQHLIGNGAQVIITGTNEARGSKAARQIGALFLEFDATDIAQAESLVDKSCQLAGRIDVLFNNAGDLGRPQGVEATTSEAFDHTLAIHLRSPWILMSRVAPVMRANGGGSIINMASVAGQRVGASSVAYSVGKAALIHLTRCAAAEFGVDNIRVNSISPGFIPTSIHASAIAGGSQRRDRFVESASRLFRSWQSLDKNGQTVDVAELALFLASDASAFVTGSDIVTDGGLMWGRNGLL